MADIVIYAGQDFSRCQNGQVGDRGPVDFLTGSLSVDSGLLGGRSLLGVFRRHNGELCDERVQWYRDG